MNCEHCGCGTYAEHAADCPHYVMTPAQIVAWLATKAGLTEKAYRVMITKARNEERI